MIAEKLDLSEKESLKSLQLFVQKYLRSRIKNFLKNANLFPSFYFALKIKKSKLMSLILNDKVLQETLNMKYAVQ